MKLQTKIKIDLLDFFKNGKFDCIKLGKTKEWILSNFPDPDGFNNDYLRPNQAIWTYGNIEFHFDKANELFLIYSDYVKEIDGGENLELNKWILENNSKLALLDILAELNKQEINYKKIADKVGTRLTLQSGVELRFGNGSDEETVDPNQLHLTSFALLNREESGFH